LSAVLSERQRQAGPLGVRQVITDTNPADTTGRGSADGAGAGPRPRAGLARAVRGSWPLWVGALLLAGHNAMTLYVSGSAWGVTFAFALWGSKVLDALGVDVLQWQSWQDPANLEKWNAGVLPRRRR
jgi:hypothetical protein